MTGSTAPVERVDVLHGMKVVHSVKPFAAADLAAACARLLFGAKHKIYPYLLPDTRTD